VLQDLVGLITHKDLNHVLEEIVAQDLLEVIINSYILLITIYFKRKFSKIIFWKSCYIKFGNILLIIFYVILGRSASRRGGRGAPRQATKTPTAEELDAELEAYVNEIK
jgi:hypothetical protein